MHEGGAWRPWPVSAPRALLALLACRDGWWTREALVVRLRPDAPEVDARRYVRQVVHRARHLPEGADVEVDGDRVRWSVDSDVGAFRRAVLALDASALAVPVDRFLEGWRGPDAAYDAWVEEERSDLLRSRRRVARALAAARVGDGDLLAASRAAEVLLIDDPLDEATLVDVVRWRADGGDGPGALALLEAFEERLADELGERPSAAARGLGERLRRSTGWGRGPGAPTPASGAVGFATPFHGREPELRRLAAALEGDGPRVVALVGLGGAGKTRLAAEAAARAKRTGFEVVEVSLANADPRASVADRIAAALPIGWDVVDAESRWRAWAARGSGLLVLDEVEELVTAGDALDAWFEAVRPTLGKVRVWLTGRVAPGWSALEVWPVDGLAVPPPSASTDEVRTAAGVRLLLARAGFDPDAVGDADVRAAATVAREVGGHPLALELLAAATRGVPAARAYVDGVASVLAGGAHAGRGSDLRAGHRDLAGLLAATWAALPASEAVAARRLATFHGPFDLAAAQEVAGADAATLARWFDRALVRREALDRYALHPLVRRSAPPRTVADLDAHARWALGRVASAGRRLRTEGHAAALDEVGELEAEVRAAWRHALPRAAAVGEPYVGLLEGALEPLDHAWHAAGRLGTAATAYREALDALEALGSAGADCGGDGDARLRLGIWAGRVRVRWVTAERNLGRPEAAAHLAELSGAADPDLRLEAVLERAKAADRMGRLAEADAGYRAVLADRAVRRRPDLAGAAHVGIAQQLWTHAADVEEALAHDDAALVAARRDGDPDALAIALINAGAGAYERGRVAEAEERWREAIAIAHQLGHRAREAAVWNNLGLAAWRRGRTDEARDAFESSLKLRRALGDRRGLASVLLHLGQLAAGGGVGAGGHLEEAIATFDELDDVESRALAYAAWADVAAAAGDGRRAAGRAAAALSDAVRSASVRATLAALLAHARAWAAAGHAVAAATLASWVAELADGRDDAVRGAAATLAAAAVADPTALRWPVVGRSLEALATAVGDGRVAPPAPTDPEWNAPGTPRR